MRGALWVTGLIVISSLPPEAGGLTDALHARRTRNTHTFALEPSSASRPCKGERGGLSYLSCIALRGGGGDVLGGEIPGSILMADLRRSQLEAWEDWSGAARRGEVKPRIDVSGMWSRVFAARGGHELQRGNGVVGESGSRSSSPNPQGNPKGTMGRSLCEGRGKEIYLPGVLRDDGSHPGGSPKDSGSDTSQTSRSCSPGAAGPGREQKKKAKIPELRPLPPGRDPTYFNPSPFSTWANNAVTISFVRGAEDLCDPSRQAHPLFTHQVFGPQEEIVGYNEPSVNIIFAANTLRPCITFKHMGTVPEEDLNAAKVLAATPVDYVVRNKLPCDYASSVEEVLKDASNTKFVPLGVEFATYEAPAADQGFQPRGGEGASAEPKMSCFKLYRAELKDRKSVRFVKRLETICVWCIERASYIKPDGNWELITLYEVYEKDGKEMYQLVGFTTTYRDYTGKNIWSERQQANIPTYKLRLSQYVILPIFQRCGHGGRMLNHIYEMARKTEDIVEVTVEEPHSDMFIEMRDRTDSQIIMNMDLLDSLTEDNPPYEALRRQLKWSRAQLRRLSQYVIKKVIREPSPGAALCTAGGVEYFAEDFVLVRGVGDLPYLAHIMGLNPSTHMLRVRWVYRYDEVPQAAIRTVPRVTAAYYKRQNACNALEVLYTFHEGFVSPQTLLGKCAVLLSTHEPVDPTSQLEGLSAFFCRFVYDPARNRVWSFLETKIKPKFRRILDETLSRNEYPFPVFSGDHVLIASSSQGSSASSATELDDSKSEKRDTATAVRTEPVTGDPSSIASSIAYSDTQGCSKRSISLDSIRLACGPTARSSSTGDSCESGVVCKRPVFGGKESIVCIRRRRAKARSKYGTPSSSCAKITGASETFKEEVRDTMLLAPRALHSLLAGEDQLQQMSDTVTSQTRTGGKCLGGVHFSLKSQGGCRLNFKMLIAELSAAAKKLGEQIKVLQGELNESRETAGTGREGGMVLECLFAQLAPTCMRELEKMMTDPDGQPFLLPVDPKMSNCRDYNSVISLPMDLGAVMGKLKRGTYKSAWGFVSDVLQTYNNAIAYNPPDHPIHMKATRLSSQFKASMARTFSSIYQVFTENLRDPWHLACAQILRGLLMRPGAWPFLSPVDPDALGIPDYPSIIKSPMDLGTAARKLQGGEYSKAEDMVADVHLTLQNAMTYNPPGHQVHRLAKRLKEVFEAQWETVKKDLTKRPHAWASSLSTSPTSKSLGSVSPETRTNPLQETSQTDVARNPRMELD